MGIAKKNGSRGAFFLISGFPQGLTPSAMMLAQLVSVALTASVKATDTKSVSSFNHFPLLFVPQGKSHDWIGYLAPHTLSYEYFML